MNYDFTRIRPSAPSGDQRNDRRGSGEVAMHARGEDFARLENEFLNTVCHDTLVAFRDGSHTVRTDQAGRAMVWSGRLRQTEALADTARFNSVTLAKLRTGTIEELLGQHAMVLTEEYARAAFSSDRLLALQVAAMFSFGWSRFGAGLLRTWWGQGDRLRAYQAGTIGGIAGVMLRIASQCCEDGKLPPYVPKKPADPALERFASSWDAPEQEFIEAARVVANRRKRHIGPMPNCGLPDFDLPLAQTVPIEILMVLRMRRYSRVPAALAEHPAFFHPAAHMLEYAPPPISWHSLIYCEVMNQRHATFLHLLDAVKAELD